MILILGGTSDSLRIAEKLKKAGIDFYLSVVSDYGQNLAATVTDNVIKGRLSIEEMIAFIREHQVKQVIDATHPFAVEVSKNAISASETAQIAYIRFERPSAIPSGVILTDSVESACKKALDYQGKIYLTTGSKTLSQFAELLPKDRLIVRVLPTAEVLTITEKLGLKANQIEAIQGPFSKELNISLLQHNHAGVMITKESGQAGGFLEKIEACKELKIPCIVIEREKIDYPKQFSTVEQLIIYVQRMEDE